MKALYRVLALAAPMVVQFSSAWALSVGQIRANAVLGQPLNLAVPVTTAEGEELSADCVFAEIIAGDYKVPPQNVRTRLSTGRTTGEAIVRVSTVVVVEEPVLTVTVSIGCVNKASRTVTLFADPPKVTLAEATVPATEEPAPVAAAPSVVPRGASAAPSAAAAVAAPSAPSAVRPKQPRRVRNTAVITPPRSRIVARPARAPSSTSSTESLAASREPVLPPTLAKAAPVVSAPAAAASAGRPALKLEAVPNEPGASAAAQAAASQATATANAALAAADAASSAQARLRALEEELARLRQQSKQQAEQYSAMQAQMSKPRGTIVDQSMPWLVPLLGAMAGVFGLTSLWLWLRSRRIASRDAAWWDAQSSEQREAPTSTGFHASRTAVFNREARHNTDKPVAGGTADSQFASQMPGGLITDSVAPSQGLDSLMSPRTVEAVPPSSNGFAASTPFPADNAALSVDEQIDVEQQADFFIALGHDDEAIDLLMANLRSTGGASPLPYLKLLEIHRRLGQREEYERTRTRFNQRFNSVAPDWSTDPSSGRMLEQYTLPMGRIQHAWPSPLDAMIELEALLFGRSETAEVFDLPAYQEVLLLYQVARELHTSDRNAGAADDVDVLLPIGATGGAASESSPFVGEGTILIRPEFNAGRHIELDLELETQKPVQGGDVKVTGELPSVSRQNRGSGNES